MTDSSSDEQPQYGPSPYDSPSYGPSPYGQSPYGQSPYGRWVPPAPKPGIVPLRPLSVSEILDGSFTALRRNPRATLGLAAIVTTITTVASTVAADVWVHLVRAGYWPAAGQPITSADARPMLEHLGEVIIPALAIITIITFLADAILTGMLTAVIGHGVLGRRLAIGEAWRIARPRLGALVGSTLLSGLIIFGTLVGGIGVSAGLGAAIIAAHAQVIGGLVIFCGVVASIIFGLIFMVRYAITAPAVVLEGQRPVAALRRSWRLVRKSSWRVFGIVLLTYLIVTVASAVLEIPFNLISAVAGGGSHGVIDLTASANTSVTGTIITAVGAIAAGSVSRPVLAGARALLYVDLRMRREGLDIALQARAGQRDTADGQPDTADGSVWDVQPDHGGAAGPSGQQRW